MSCYELKYPYIDTITPEITTLLQSHDFGQVGEKYRRRLEEGNLTRAENSQSHFCVTFLPVDIPNRQIFIGHHKKSGLWLCFGGHIETGETIETAVRREITEECGTHNLDMQISPPEFITTTLIDNPKRDSCRLHFDVWHFFRTDTGTFSPDPVCISEEFYRHQWVTLPEARQLPTSKSMLQSFDFIEKNLFT